MNRINLYNNNCINVMRELGDSTVDLICTDPPYNLGKFMKDRQTNLKKMRENFFGAAGWDDLDNQEWLLHMDDEDRRIQCQTILVALALKFEVEINNELGRKIRMSPLGQKIFNEGIEEGQLEKQKEIAKNLMDILNDEMIAKKCGLTIDEVKKLRSEIEKDNN